MGASKKHPKQYKTSLATFKNILHKEAFDTCNKSVKQQEKCNKNQAKWIYEGAIRHERSASYKWVELFGNYFQQEAKAANSGTGKTLQFAYVDGNTSTKPFHVLLEPESNGLGLWRAHDQYRLLSNRKTKVVI